MEYFGFHAFQSFAPGEVTPEVAHEIGVKLAQELWGDRFEVVVATHLNTNCIHNHFCLNSVSFKDGKKYYSDRSSYAVLRRTSDELCKEYNLSVIQEKPCGKHNIDYQKYSNEQIQKSNYHNSTKIDIDYAIEQAYSYNQFLNILKSKNYKVINRAGKLSVRREPYQKNIRIERAFGENYKIENIRKRIMETEPTKIIYPKAKTLNNRFIGNTSIKNKKKAKGIRALYLYYCYLLKIYPKTNPKQKFSEEMRAEIRKMNMRSKEARFLAKTGIQTVEELNSYKAKMIEQRRKLKGKRENLYKQNRKAKTEEEKQEIQEKLQSISKELKVIYEQEKWIKDIETRVPKIKEIVKEENKEQGKEKKEHEYVK